MKKLFVLAIVVMLSLSLVWAADNIKNTDQNATKGKVVTKAAPESQARTVTPTPKAQRPANAPAKTEIPEPSVPKVAVDQKAAPEATYLGVGNKETEPSLSEKEADAPTIEQLLNPQSQEVKEPLKSQGFPAEEGKWVPEYGPKGDLLNPQPTFNSLPNNNQDIPIIAETQLFNENFSWGQWNPTSMMNGWTTTMDDGGPFWDNYDWARYSSTSWGVAYARNYSASNARLCDDWLISPAFDFSAATTCSVHYRYYYDAFSTVGARGREHGYVKLSTDGGATWGTLVDYSADDSGTSTSPKYNMLDISAQAAGFSSVMVAFHHVKDSLFTGGYFGLDNVGFVADGVFADSQTFDETGWGWQTGNASWAGPANEWTGWTAIDNVEPTDAASWNNNDWHYYYSTTSSWGDTVADIYYIPDEFSRDKLISPVIDLTGQPSANLRLTHFFDYGPGDSGLVLGTNDAWATTQVVGVFTGADYGSGTVPDVAQFDLSAWAGGQSAVQLAFQWIRGGASTSRSWAIGNVELYAPDPYEVMTTAVGVPAVANDAINWPVVSSVYNNGGMAATFQDSTFIEQLNSTTLLYENFSNPQSWTGANPPINTLGAWVVADSGNTPGVWNNADWHGFYYSSFADTVARVYYMTTGETSDAYLLSPSMDCSAATNVHLSFRNYYNYDSGDMALVIGTTNDWATIDTIALWTSDQGSTSGPVFVFDISSWAAGQSNVKVGFRYIATNNWYWYVDDVTVWTNLPNTTAYVDGATVTGLAPNTGTDVTFPTTWNTPSAGDYVVTQFTSLAGDANTANDTMMSAVTVYPHTGTGGPDLGYYSYIDNTQGGGPTYSWVDMSSATPITFTSTDLGYSYGLPVGNFFFYGSYYDSIYASVDGLLSFLPISGSFSSNYSIPNTLGANNMIAFWWNDLQMWSGVNPAGYWLDDIANNRFVVEYDNFQEYGTPNSDTFDAQIILDRNDWSITVQYAQIGTDLDYTITVGIENAAGDIGQQYYYNTNFGNFPWNGLAIKFFYTPPARDVVVNSVLAPTGLVLNGASVTPSVVLSNAGSVTENFNTYFKIFDSTPTEVYTDMVAVSLTSGQVDTIDFAATSFSVNGTYSCSTYVDAGDPTPANDFLTSTFTVDQHYGEGGPDAGMYKWIDNTVVGGPTFSWVDMTGATAITFTSTDDGYSQNIPLGGTFYFYGMPYDSIQPISNGHLGFTRTTSSNSFNYGIPNTSGPENIIAFCWDDMLSPTASYLDDAINNRTVIEFQNINFYSSPAQASDTFDVQIILDRDDSTIVVQYDDFGPLTYFETGITVGIENIDATAGLQYYYNGAPILNYIAEGLAIKFYYYTPAIDVALTSIDAPGGGMVGNTAYPAATVTNTATTAVTADVTFKIVGPAPATDTVFSGTETTPTINPGQSAAFTFTAGWTPAAAGSYNVLVNVTTAGDEIASNNDGSLAAYIFGAAASFPYASDFESDGGNFAGLSEWEWGAPTYASGPTAAHSGTNLWGTDLDNTYDAFTLNTLYSPPINLTGAVAPLVKFWMWRNLESGYDGANLNISTDYGNTWTIFNTDVAYNSTGYSTAPGIAGEPVWDGALDWTEAKADLTPYVGQTVVFRIDQSADASVQYAGFYVDDFEVVEAPPVDVVFDYTVGQVGAAGNIPVCAAFSNTGSGDGIANVTFVVNDGTSDVFTGTGSGTVPGNGTATICASTDWAATPGTYTITVTAVVADDNDPLNNDGAGSIVVVGASTPIPYAEDFESTTLTFPPAGWTILHYGDSDAPNGTWQEDTTAYRSPNHSAFQDDEPSTAYKDEWLVMKPLDFTAAYLPKWKYYEDGQYWSYGIAHEFYVGTGPVFDINTATLVGQHTPTTHTLGAFDGAPGDEFDMDTFNGNAVVWCAFRYIGAYSDDWYIDDISILDSDQYDGEVTLVDVPLQVEPGDPIPITIELSNNGYLAATADLTTIGVGSVSGPVYSDVQTGISIPAFGTVSVPLPAMSTTAACGENYTITATVAVAGDTISTNDVGIGYTSTGYMFEIGNIDNYIYYYWSSHYRFARIVHQPTVGVIDHAVIAFQDIAVPRVTFDFSIYDADGTTGAPNAVLYGPITIQNVYPDWTNIDIRAIAPTLPDSFYMVVNNLNGASGTYTGPLSDAGELGGYGCYYKTTDTTAWTASPYTWGFSYVVDVRPSTFTDLTPVSIDAPGDVIIGDGPFAVNATIANNGLGDVTDGVAHMTITGNSGVEYDVTLNGLAVTAGSTLPLVFGDWTPSEGGVTYALDLTLSTVSPEGDVCNNTMSASCLAITGQVDVFEDFETDNGGFAGSATWEYGAPTVGPAPYSGVNVWGTILAGDYPIDACDSLRTPAYTVPAAGGAMVVYVWYSNEQGWDGFNIKMSVDGGAYNVVTPVGGYDDVEGGYVCDLVASQGYFTGASGAWVPKAVDISAYAGQSVSFSFDFASDGSVVEPGSYLDDFTIYNYSTGPSGCVYIPGDINGNGVTNGIDVGYGVNYFKGAAAPPIDCAAPVGPCPQASPFYAGGDVNGNCVFNGIDITFFVNYLKGIQPALLFCADCPPAAPAPAVVKPVLKARILNGSSNQ